MPQVDIEDLINLDNVEKLADIFTHRLNYDYEGSPLSTRRWKEDIASSILNSDIKLLVQHQDFHIIYCKIEKLLLSIERPIINQLLREHPYLLVVFSDKFVKNWHFVNIEYDDEVKNRKIYRRKHIISIVEKIYKCDKDEADEICDIYGSRGYEFLRAIYEGHNK